MTEPGPRPRRGPLVVAAGVLVAASAAVAYLVAAWWSIVPLAAVLGGLAGIGLRWYLAPVVGFLSGFAGWAVPLLLLPAEPRTKLADVLGAAEGLSGPFFLWLGPLLIGLLGLLAGCALFCALRLVRPPTAREASTPA